MSAASLHHHICLICGCNTNQTINIYEPRSGPNIVELIQAKFKFQPLNEDKYLCFSCNNWLINWHSLQANNSNDAESPSGTFRSSQVNGGMAQEKRSSSRPNPPEQNQQQKQQQQRQQQHQHRQNQIQSSTAVCRPIAQVRPRQLVEALKSQSKLEAITSEKITSARKLQFQYPTMPMPISLASKERTKHSYAKRCMNGTYRNRRSSKKHLSHCCVCGRAIVIYIRSASGALRHLSKPKRTAKCRKCRSVCQWRSIYMHNLTKERSINAKALKYKTLTETTAAPKSLVNTNDCPPTTILNTSRNHSEFLKRPLVDGKIVAMLRRLGTTLSRDAVSSTQQLPPIMSPTKPTKQRWTRPLEADEILLHFETAISEVLPIVESKNISTKQTPTRRKLTYQMSCGSEYEKQSNEQDCTMTSAYQDILSSLPKGLDISLI